MEALVLNSRQHMQQRRNMCQHQCRQMCYLIAYKTTKLIHIE